MKSPEVSQPHEFRLSQRRLLALTAFALGGAAAYGVLRPSSTPQVLGAQDVPSFYFSEAVTIANNKIEDTATKNDIKKILENIDQQGLDNLTIFHSQLFPGVSFPVTEVDINKIYSEIFKKDQTAHPLQRRYVVFPGFSWPPAGHPFTPWDITYDRVFRSLPKAATEQIKIVGIGSPNGLWGTVSQDWVKRLNDGGFIPYINLYKEYLEASLPAAGRPNTKMVMQGISQGAAVAKLIAEDAAEGAGLKSLQLRLDNPVGLQVHPSLLFKAQIGLGFLAEVGIFVFTDRGKSIRRDETAFYEKAKPVLAQRGLDPQDNQTQTALKQAAAWADIKAFFAGPTHPLGNKVRSYVAKGRFDPLTLGRSSHLENSFQVEVNSTHMIDRFRVLRWQKIIQQLS